MKLYLLLFLTIFTEMYAQVDKQSELFLELKKMDQLVFDEGFNNCNMEALVKVTASDLEFYHDKGGIQNKEEFLSAMRTNICGDTSRKITRKPVEESVEVFPLYNGKQLYGAIQEGEHLFYAQEKGAENLLTGYAKFTSLWLLVDGEWKLKRVLSYDHQAR